MRSADKVVDLHQDTKNIATGVSIVVGLADDRQMTFQSGFEGDESDAVVNGRLDRLMRIADRQKARYDIADAQKKLAQHRSTALQAEVDWAEIEQRQAHQIATLKVEYSERVNIRDAERKAFETEINGSILEMQEAKANTWNQGEEAHKATGRLSAYKPDGAVKVNLIRIDKAIQTAKDNREAALADFDKVYDEGLTTSAAEIEKAEAEVAEKVRHNEITRVNWRRIEDDLVARVEACEKLIEGT